MKQHNYYVYIMASITHVIYIGVTNDLRRRTFEHKSGLLKGFSSKYRTRKLVHYQYFSNIDYAIRREKEIKKWRREKKVALIESMNPGWDDLSLQFR